MRQYEVTFIVDPALSGDEIKSTAQAYVDHLQKEGCKIVHVDEMGLRELSYPLNKKNSGYYYCIEFQAETGELIPKMELALRRDERILRFLTVKLDKYGIKYNEDKRAGLIGKVKKKPKPEKGQGRKQQRGKQDRKPKQAPAPQSKTEQPIAPEEVKSSSEPAVPVAITEEEE